MNCIYKKIRTKKGIKYGYCTLHKKEVDLFKCNCNNKEYKQVKTTLKTTYKHRKNDLNRFSIIYPQLDKCVVCGSKIGLNKHEIFYGTGKRQLSIKYGLVISLCQDHHTGKCGIHFNKELNEYWRNIAKIKFKETYKDLDFVKVFNSK